MPELKRCFTALGFEELPIDEAAVLKRYSEMPERIRSNTESDRLAQQLLQENRDLCLRALRGEE